MLKEVNEGIMTMSHQIKNMNKDIKVIKNNQIVILQLETIITEIKNSLKVLNSKFQLAKKKITKLEYRLIEIIQSKKHRKNNLKIEQSLKEIWDTIKHISVCEEGVSEGEEREKEAEKNIGKNSC